MTALFAAPAVFAQPVPDRFGDVLLLDAPDAAVRIARCVGSAEPDAARAWIEARMTAPDPDEMREYAPPEGRAIAVTAKGWWACLSLSPARFPIYPLESIAATIAVGGVPDFVLAEWHRKLLEVLAEKGEARGLIVYPNGNGLRFEFKAVPGSFAYLRFTKEFLKADKVDEAGIDAVLRDPAVRGINIVNPVDPKQPDFKGQPALPEQRIKWPLDGDFLKAPPGPVNATAVLDNTRWTFTQSTTVMLRPGGVAVMTSPRSTSNGTWEFRDGVVYMKMGTNLFYTLRLAPDGQGLNGRTRNTSRPVRADFSPPSEWKTKLTREAAP
ncbi:MAG: hypothetical protein ABIP59_16285 [Roseateles sp.]